MRFIVFLIMFAIGLGFILKTGPIVDFTGRIGWAERHFGATGTYTFYKLLGLGIIFAGLIYVTGMVNGILDATVGNVVRPQ